MTPPAAVASSMMLVGHWNPKRAAAPSESAEEERERVAAMDQRDRDAYFNAAP